VLLGGIVLIFSSRLKRLQKDAIIKKEINELHRATLSAQMNPHFIFNSLNSIQKFITQNEQKSATTYLAKFSQLIRSTLNASLHEEISLLNEISWLENYLDLEKLRFKERFDFSIKVDAQLDQFDTMIPPLLTQPFVENAILHGFAEIKNGGFLEVHFSKKDEKLEITIQDNGCGIFQAQQKKSHHSEQHGVGITISQKRLELADVLNEFEIKEVKNKNGEVIGTLVKLVINT
jgi:LytS/YehU family sensor histidine kinase